MADSSGSLSVLIVGCGNIAGGFDVNNSHTDYSLTHVKAYTKNLNFFVKACCDTDLNKLNDFSKRWNITNSFSSIEEIVDKRMNFDVVSICNPSENHSSTLELVGKLKPKVVFCEKPLTLDLKKTEEISRLYKNLGIGLAVNFNRRWMKYIEELKIGIQDKRWGELRSVVSHYNKGILNNGSHLIDLLSWLLGQLSILWVGKPVFDYNEKDPSIPAVLCNEQGIDIFLNATNSKDFSLFEIQFYFEKGVVSLENGAMSIKHRVVGESKVFTGYKVLSENYETTTDYYHSMDTAVQNIYDAIHSGIDLKSNSDNALIAQRICEAILKESFRD